MFKGKKSYFVIIFLLFIILSIGYAYLNTTLVIHGNSDISKNTWDIHFDNLLIDDGSVISDPPEITSDTITFDTILSKPGDFYRFTVDLVNAGTLNAEIEKIEFTSNLLEEVADFLLLNVTYEDGTMIGEKQYLLSESSKKVIFNLEYSKNIETKDLPQDDLSLSFTLKVIYKQPDYEPDAQINTVKSTSWNQRPGISMYNAINSNYQFIKAGEYFVTDMDFSKDVFLNENGKVLNLKKLMIKGGKIYNSIGYVNSAKVTEEMIFSGNHDTIFVHPIKYGEAAYDRDVAVFVDPSDTYQNVVHAAFMMEMLVADLLNPKNIEAIEQDIIEEYVLGFPSGQNLGCNDGLTNTHRFYKINHLERSLFLLLEFSETDMTYEDSKDVVIDMLNEELGIEEGE